MNNTIIGSRAYGHHSNVFESVNKGGPGTAVPQETWATSTYEKDGSQIHVGTNRDFTDIFKSEGRSNTYAVDDRTIYYSTGTVFAVNPLSVSQLYVCLDDECRQWSGLETMMLLWILVPHMSMMLVRPYESVTRSTPPWNGLRLFKRRMIPTMCLKLGEMYFPWKEGASLVLAPLKKTCAPQKDG
jgi:hypothetical protein